VCIGLVLGGAIVGQAYLTAEVVAQGAAAPRWAHLLASTVAVVVATGVNIMTELLSRSKKRSDVAQLEEHARCGAHRCHEWGQSVIPKKNLACSRSL
jgi:hypothetical protein